MIRPLPYIFKILLFPAVLGASLSSKSQCPAFNATATPSFQAICSGTSITPIVLSSNQPGTIFNWTRDNTTAVTGIAPSGSGNISGTLVNTTNAPVYVSFTITPQTTQLINESFNTILPAGWAQQNLSSLLGFGPQSTWFAGTAFPPYSPAGFIAANYNSTAPGGTVSNWLFTPTITFRAGDQISFYTRTARHAVFPDRLQLRMSSNGASLNAGIGPFSVGDFTTLIFDINPTYAPIGYPDTWTQFNFIIPSPWASPPGGSGRLAFRYFMPTGVSPGDNSDMIGIDDFLYTTSAPCIGTPITATVLVNPAATVNTVSNQTICTGTTTLPVNFSSPTTGGAVTYNWTNNNTSIGLGASGSGNIPSFTGVNTGNAPISGTVTVTPTFSSTGSSFFANPNPIVIPASGPATAYPSTINVSGLPVNARLIAVALNGITHTAPGEMNILLRSPSGQSVILMSDAGGTNAIAGVNIILTDLAISIPVNGPIASGTYTCSNYAGLTEPDIWPAPGPGAVTQPNPSLSLFSASNNPNGQWALFVVDQANGNNGAINGGWILFFDQIGTSTCTGTPGSFTYTVNPLPTASIISNIPPPILPGQVMTLTAVVSPAGGTFVWYKDGVAVPGATSNTLAGLTVNDLGNYSVTYTDPNGCVNTSTVFNVYARSSSNLYVYPNPTTGQFNIRFYNEPNEEVTVTVYDHLGLKVFQKKYQAGSQRYSVFSLQDQHFNTGNYFVEVVNSRGEKIGFKSISVLR